MGRSATSASALLRRLAPAASVFVLVLAASCGNETFNLLGIDGGSASGGTLSTTLGAGGARTSFAGADRGGASSKAGAGSGGNGAAGNASGGGIGFSAGGFTAAGFAGEGQGGDDQFCLPGDPCVDGGVVCPPSVGACTRCQTNDQCGHNGLPYCDVVDARCVECLPNKDNCKVGENCDPSFLRCEKACASAADCASDPTHRVCAVSRGVCVQCVSKSDCAGTYQCAAGFCVECLDNSSCTDPSKPMCLQYQCVPKQ